MWSFDIRCHILSPYSLLQKRLKVEINFETILDKKLAGKNQVDSIGYKIDDAYVSSQHIQEYIDKCKHLYDTRRNLNEFINTLTLWLMIFVIIAVIGSTFYQVTSLKRFFVRRKMI